MYWTSKNIKAFGESLVKASHIANILQKKISDIKLNNLLMLKKTWNLQVIYAFIFTIVVPFLVHVYYKPPSSKGFFSTIFMVPKTT